MISMGRVRHKCKGVQGREVASAGALTRQERIIVVVGMVEGDKGWPVGSMGVCAGGTSCWLLTVIRLDAASRAVATQV